MASVRHVISPIFVRGYPLDDPTSLMVELGFSRALLEPIRGKLPAVCSVLFEPFAQVGKFDMSTWHRSERIDDILGDDRWNFRMAGPANVILLMRAFRGLLYYLQRLDQPVSWGIVLEPILQRHENALSRIKLPAPQCEDCTFESMARHLRIEVHRNGRKRVSLTLPATPVEDLDSLIDDELRTRIEARRIDTSALIRDVRRSGYKPTNLFTLDEPDADRRIRVWIE